MSVAVSEVDVPARTIAAVEAQRGAGPLAVAIRSAFDRLYRHIQPQGGQRFGNNVLFYEKRDSFVAGVTDAAIKAPGEGVEILSLAGGHAAHAVHIGDYARMEKAYGAIDDWMNRNGRQASNRSLEVYDHMDPSGATPPRTDVFVFLAAEAT